MSTRHVDRRSPVSSEGHSHLLPGGFNSLRFFRTLLLSTVVWGNQSTTDLRERKRKEMLRDMWRGHKLLKYAFKSKDHTYFRGAHGFMRTHKWRHSIGAFINVEASGTGGLDLVCQSGPGSWPSSVYAKSAIYPMAHSAAQIVPGFRVRIIPVLGTIPAIFGQVMASYVVTQLAGLDVQTEPVGGFWMKLAKTWTK